MVTPLPYTRSEQPDSPLEHPEVLAINALLEVGWTPSSYGLDSEMVRAWSTAWNWCQDYYDKTGKTPGVDHFARTFPTFEVVRGVDPKWAADQLREAHHIATMKRLMQQSIAMINEGDVGAAREALLEAVSPALLARPQGLNVLDPASVAETALKSGWRVPWGSLQALTLGGGKGELWYLAARLGQGKSWMTPAHAVVAAEMGARVNVLTCEMPAGEYTRRIHAYMAREHPDLRAALLGESELERKAALRDLPFLAGSIEVFDPARIRMSIKGVEQACLDADMVAVDHVGLLSDASGKRAVEDWRVMAVISNTLKELALTHEVWMLCAAQINREGEHAGSTPPKVSNLSQSDALGQDADVVITYKRIGERAMLHNLGKNRNGRNGRFYTMFEPGKANFVEISADAAREIGLQDADRLADAV